MGLSRTQRIARCDLTILGGLELSPHDYFVLSRIEGKPTVGEVIVGSGLGRDEVQKILERLLDLGAITQEPEEAAAPSQSPTSSSSSGAAPGDDELRRRARERRRTLLGAMLSSRSTDGQSSAPRETVESPARTPSPEPAAVPAAEAAPAPKPTPEPFRDIELVPEHDPRLDPNAAIAIDDQRWLLALADRVDELDEFSFLGIGPTDDLKVIRRAYHERSRRLHPDTYYGRELGFFRDLLAALFSHAKQAHRALQDPKVRARALAREAAIRQMRALEEEARLREAEAAASERSEQEEAQRAAAQERRRARAQERVRRQRSQMRDSLVAEGRKHAEEAERAYSEGNLAKAANFYRLALRSDPDDAALRTRWEQIRDEARKARAATAFARGVGLLDVGHTQEAAMLLIDAADTDPTLEHLAYAADAVRHTDPERARDLALAALDALQRAVSRDETFSRSAKAAQFHLMIGRAFLSAGQVESARFQATAAHALRPDDPSVRALVNSTKVP